jgi:hypothetical protein
MAKKVHCQIGDHWVGKYSGVKKLYARQGGRPRVRYYGCACKECFNGLLNRQREKRGDINFFSDDIRELDIHTPL